MNNAIKEDLNSKILNRKKKLVEIPSPPRVEISSPLVEISPPRVEIRGGR